MKTRDHEKIVARMQLAHSKRVARLRQEIVRLRHIIELSQDDLTADVARRLYDEYLSERQEVQP